MTKTRHAEVTQEYRDLASCIEKECFRRFGDRGWATFDTSLAGQLIADYSAEVERKVLERNRWPVCKWCHTDLERWVESAGKCPFCGAIDFIEKRAELGGTK